MFLLAETRASPISLLKQVKSLDNFIKPIFPIISYDVGSFSFKCFGIDTISLYEFGLIILFPPILFYS